MTKCKKKDCSNEVSKGNKYCNYHLNQREDKGKKLIGALGTASALLMSGIRVIKKFKK
ncbi:hypothetical protein OZ415_04580 [Aerococcus urinaeequi]|uniref:Uncharacterized protein n=1 Tax=Aerococcus urinaeequi TaxID=51665 RepID=A0AA47J0V4_9LACT|nr:hypothetical protein [Aerococcus urinaeequi]WAT25344.1 hypothetical protein OZ415_04580 [Aerococcus urinaeequi]